jgi:aryl-alcohol dehydrogenase-like predicted oxidoreductase
MTKVDAGAGRYSIGGDLDVSRLGFGSMQLMGRNGFGPARDAAAATAVLRRAVELGVDLIDTADAYGPFVAETLIAEALHPYDGLVIATKGGFVRDAAGSWISDGRPQHLRDAIHGSLKRLKLERIDLYQLHRVDAAVPLADQVGTLRDLQAEGKIRHVGLSQVTVAQIEEARRITEVASVQNLYNVADRSSRDVVEYAKRVGMGFIPWFPLATGRLTNQPALLRIAQSHGVSTSQVALAWLLQDSPTMLPIPGTSSVEHLEDNLQAASLRLTDDEVSFLNALA